MSCDGCTRRFLLQSLALGTAGVLAGCGGTDPGMEPDAGPPGDGSGNPVSMCGGNLCIDISMVPALQNVNGSMVVPITTPKPDKVMVLRSSATEFDTLSAVCTHAGCTVGFSSANMRFNCPCHGSQFSLQGAVLRAPAARPLKTYANTFDAQTNVLTITLA